VRGTLKSWTKQWCILKPGLLLLYKSNKVKVYAALQRIRGFVAARVLHSHAGKCWMDALELALRCSSLLIRSMTKDGQANQSLLASQAVDAEMEATEPTLLNPTPPRQLPQLDTWNESDCESPFRDYEMDDHPSTDDGGRELEGVASEKTDSESLPEESAFEEDVRMPPTETAYIAQTSEIGSFLVGGEGVQTEEIAEENKSLVWMLLKQVRPGMDLSKVVLPTFILEPRSFLDKLTDYYYHADFLSQFTVLPFLTGSDQVNVISGKIKLGKETLCTLEGHWDSEVYITHKKQEVHRCYWRRPNSSRTFFIGEQVSHHPPISAFYVSNRQEGFCINGSILAKSKFYGNSLSAILEGYGRLTFLNRGEDYIVTMPYAHCKGILLGTLTMELGGKVTIDCEKTGYRAELEFKLKVGVRARRGAVQEEDAFLRIKHIVKWYLSGFYKKPKGLKKPYNPILGEVHRCYWRHLNGSRTFFIAEQYMHST
ncbi:PREDICTED: oxysterol-binding protein-related protein 8-like, partial [Priapulus caudatus]|uniref:Oxysterol-binding protein n=1 Tax=Priapulus caudatus TaxID=37621 RepID=A0ABM1E153_PRICU